MEKTICCRLPLSRLLVSSASRAGRRWRRAAKKRPTCQSKPRRFRCRFKRRARRQHRRFTPARDIANWAKGRKISEVPVAPGTKVFALTFDDGPWPEYTREILQILKANDVKATFFMVGQEVSRRPEIAREVRDAGHAIGNHSWDHPSRPRDPIAQVEKTDAIIRKELGFRPTFFRPPYGLMKNGMAAHAMSLRDPVLLWSADSADWKRPGVDHIVRMIVGQAHPGGISLMHDGGGNRSQDVEALPIIISSLRAKGYRFVTIPELLKLRDAKAAVQETAHKAAKKSAKPRKKAKH